MIAYAHVDRLGFVWHANAGVAASLVAYSLDEFLGGSEAAAATGWRIIGGPENVQLVYRLSSSHHAEIRLVTPRVCETRAQLGDGRMAIYCAQQCTLPRSVGGFHVLSPGQAAVYALAASQSVTSLDAVTSQAFCRAVRFVPTCDPDSVAMLAAVLLDPRWFLTPKSPERCSAARRFLGLSPAIVRRAWAGDNSMHAQRCRLVLTACGYESLHAYPDTVPNFLGRIVARTAGDTVKGALAAANVFLQFVFRAWLAQLLREDRAGDVDAFVPVLLLDEAEQQAYQEHLAVVGGV